MTLKQFIDNVHASEAPQDKVIPVEYLLASLTREASEIAGVWGSYALVAPSETARWDVTRAHICLEIGDLLHYMAELCTQLKIDFDTEVLGRCQDLQRTPTNDISLIIIGLIKYIGKLNGISTVVYKNLGKYPTPDELATAIRKNDETYCPNIGKTFIGELVAICSSITDLLSRTHIDFSDVLAVHASRMNWKIDKPTKQN